MDPAAERSMAGDGAERFLPALGWGPDGSQRLRRVPFDSLLGRRAFLGAQTTTELISSASSFTATRTRFITAFCSREVAIARAV